MSQLFLEQLRQGPLLCDGAMGTQLYQRGITYDQCFDVLNVTNPDLIQSVHSDYLSAGAQIIETNTFGANRVRLAHYNMAEKVREINIKGARLAREVRDVAGTPAFIAGAVGPTGLPLQAPDSQRLEELRTIFREQIEALLVGGIEILVLETFTSLAELRQAILAAKEIGGLPIVAQMSFYEDGHTLSGQSAARVATVLHDMGVDVVGANCSVGPARTLDVIHEMIAAVQSDEEERSLLFSAQPNAGLPQRIDNRFFYVSTPEYFADYALRFAQAGVRLIGGCCGTTPQHTQAMRKALDEQYSANAQFAAITSPPVITTTKNPTNGRGAALRSIEKDAILPNEGTKTELQKKLEAGEFVISIELDPPRGLNPTRLIKAAMQLREDGADFINIADSPMARVRMGCIALARLIQDHLGMETIIHYTTRDRNLMALQSELLGAHALGIRNILALSGDPLRMGAYPNTTGVWDVDSIGLINVIRGLNEGHDAGGSAFRAKASFHIGCALDLNMSDEETDREIEKYQRKIEAGAQFIMTQPIYELAPLERFLSRVGKPPIPVLLGSIPLHNSRHAEYLHNEVPGFSIPEDVRARMKGAGERSPEEGLKIAQEILLAAQGMIQGVYIMPSYQRYDVVGELVKTLRNQPVTG